jgi:hypothetical protein
MYGIANYVEKRVDLDDVFIGCVDVVTYVAHSLIAL